MGTAMGTVAGASIGMATYHSGIPVAVMQIAPTVDASTTTNSVVSTSAENPIPAAMPVQAVESVATPALPAHAHFSLVSYQSRPPVHPREAAGATVARPVSATLTFTSTHAPDAAPVQASAVEIGAKNFTFMSEGDVTVADFNATMGTIETYEGRTFVLGSTAAPSVAARLQDSGSSVHYRCDQSGNCTLMQAGLVMQHVRLL